MKFQTLVSKTSRNFTGELTVLSQALANIGNRLAEVLADGKVTGGEVFSSIIILPDVQTILANFKTAAKYWKTLTPEQKEAEINALADRLQISGYDAAVKVDAVFNNGASIYAGLEKIYVAVQRIHAAFSVEHVQSEENPANTARVETPKKKK